MTWTGHGRDTYPWTGQGGGEGGGVTEGDQPTRLTAIIDKNAVTGISQRMQPMCQSGSSFTDQNKLNRSLGPANSGANRATQDRMTSPGIGIKSIQLRHAQHKACLNQAVIYNEHMSAKCRHQILKQDIPKI